ncbi:hypothetical protein D3C85_1181770 [compost metagenome]
MRISLEQPRLVLTVLRHFVGAGAEHALGRIEAASLDFLHRQDRGGRHGKDGQQRGVRLGQVDAHGMGVDRDHIVHTADLLAPAARLLRICQPLQAAHHIGGGQLATVGERCVLAQLEDIGRGRDLLPRFGQLGRDVEFVIRAQQLVVDQIEDRPRRAVARRMRVGGKHLRRLAPDEGLRVLREGKAWQDQEGRRRNHCRQPGPATSEHTRDSSHLNYPSFRLMTHKCYLTNIT